MSKVKTIAFYLPQFHTIPENDQWWGKGFTEWTNTRKAKPLFLGHYQPHTPFNNDYYDLANPSVLERQSELAQSYGLDGFCYYHYWFEGGKKLLEKPIEQMLANKKVTIPFCLCWANETWARTWDGEETSVLIKQDYGNEPEWESHYKYLKQFWLDERYIKTSSGQPLMLIYKPEICDCLEQMLACWKSLAKSDGIAEPYFLVQYPSDNASTEEYFDGVVDFEPTCTLQQMRRHPFDSLIRNCEFFLPFAFEKIKLLLGFNSFRTYSYSKCIHASMNRQFKNDGRHFLGAFTSWDNSPRKGTKGSLVFNGSTPDLFYEYLVEQIRRTNEINGDKFLFINAWNEWAEGAHLEPDEKFEYGYLDALKRALEND